MEPLRISVYRQVPRLLGPFRHRLFLKIVWITCRRRTNTSIWCRICCISTAAEEHAATAAAASEPHPAILLVQQSAKWRQWGLKLTKITNFMICATKQSLINREECFNKSSESLKVRSARLRNKSGQRTSRTALQTIGKSDVKFDKLLQTLSVCKMVSFKDFLNFKRQKFCNFIE